MKNEKSFIIQICLFISNAYHRGGNRMRKIFLLGIAILLLSATANAQIRGGLKVGGNLNFPNWEPKLGGEYSSALSFNFGASLDFDLLENFGIELDLLYNNVKTQWDYSGFDPFYGALVDIDIVFTGQSISLPILAKVKIPSKQVTPFFGVGPELGIILSSKARTKISANGLVDETTVDLGDETEDINFAITLCGGADINLGRVILSPELRFSLWLIDVDESEVGTAKNSQIVFFFGVKF